MPFAPRRGLYVTSAWLAAAYFALIKTFSAGARLHVELLTALLPSHRFSATADWTDLVCLPLVVVAFRFLVRSS